MSNQRCKHARPDGFNCGSYAFSLYKEGIDQGDLCDVHYWQNKAQRQPLTDEEIGRLWDGHTVPVFGKNGINPIVFARAVEAAHGITGENN